MNSTIARLVTRGAFAERAVDGSTLKEPDPVRTGVGKVAGACDSFVALSVSKCSVRDCVRARSDTNTLPANNLVTL